MRSFGRDIVIVVCAISAGIHAALTPAHFGEGLGAGFGFLVATIVLAGLAAALTHSADRPVLAVAVVTLAGLLAAYVAAITTGVPLLHPETEPVDGLALVTKAIEAVGLVAAARLLVPVRSLVRTRLERKLT